MSLDIRSHIAIAVDYPADEIAAEKRMRRFEMALLVGAAAVAIVLFSFVSVLIHLA